MGEGSAIREGRIRDFFLEGEWFLGPQGGGQFGLKGGENEGGVFAFGRLWRPKCSKKFQNFVEKRNFYLFFSFLQNFRPPAATSGGTVINKTFGCGGALSWTSKGEGYPPPRSLPLAHVCFVLS